jgi:hypothetical protein
MKLSGCITEIIFDPIAYLDIAHFTIDSRDKSEFVNNIFWMCYLTEKDFKMYAGKMYLDMYLSVRMDVHILYRINKIKKLLK